MSNASPFDTYPRCVFHLSPTSNKWCPLRAADIQRLKVHPKFEGQNIYFYRNLPITWVRIVGMVVEVNEFAGRRVFTIDDSSGACIEAVAIIKPAPKEAATAPKRQPYGNIQVPMEPKVHDIPYEHIDVGTVVNVTGDIGVYRGARQIKINRMVGLRSTEEEIALWEKRARFYRDALEKPWVVSKEEVRRCMEEFEMADRERENKARKLRQRISGMSYGASKKKPERTRGPISAEKPRASRTSIRRTSDEEEGEETKNAKAFRKSLSATSYGPDPRREMGERARMAEKEARRKARELRQAISRTSYG